MMRKNKRNLNYYLNLSKDGSYAIARRFFNSDISDTYFVNSFIKSEDDERIFRMWVTYSDGFITTLGITCRLSDLEVLSESHSQSQPKLTEGHAFYGKDIDAMRRAQRD